MGLVVREGENMLEQGILLRVLTVPWCLPSCLAVFISSVDCICTKVCEDPDPNTQLHTVQRCRSSHTFGQYIFSTVVKDTSLLKTIIVGLSHCTCEIEDTVRLTET